MQKPEPFVNSDTVFSVTDASALLKGVVETAFPRIKIRGELSQITRATSGHMYMTIKDSGAAISVIIWRGTPVPFKLEGDTRKDETPAHIAVREALINTLVHADYSVNASTVITRSKSELMFSNPGCLLVSKQQFYEGGDSVCRNVSLQKMFMMLGKAEKAGSGFDKIFTDLLKKGKSLPEPEETESSVIFRIKSNVVCEKLIELSLQYESQVGKPMKLDELLVLSEVVHHKQIKVAELMVSPNISAYRLQTILDKLHNLEFIEPTGKTSGLSYILHISKRTDIDDKIEYVKNKKQEKARQKEAILRYLDSIDTINNTEARLLLKLHEKDRAKVSRLFAELVNDGEIMQTEDSRPNNVKYKRLNNN